MPPNTSPQKLNPSPRSLTQELDQLLHQINRLQLPSPVFMGIHIHPDYNFQASQLGGSHPQISFHQSHLRKPSSQSLPNWLKRHERDNHIKIIAAGLGGRHRTNQLLSDLWLKHDIVPHLISQTTHASKEDLIQTARIASNLFFPDLSTKPLVGEHNQVDPSVLVRLQDYQETVTPSQWALLEKFTRLMGNTKLTFISATPQGGGVALMRHALIRLYRLLGVNASWHVLDNRPEIFAITKVKFHNVLQAVTSPDTRLTGSEKRQFNRWSTENAQSLQPVIQESQVIVIDDPQPSGLIPHIKIINPQAKIIYRSHIQIEASLAEQPGTPQNATWKYLWNFINKADVFVSHPINQFVPRSVPLTSRVTMGATTDLLDGLNKPLTPFQVEYYLKVFNKFLLDTHQSPLDLNRPYIAQIARFDPSKGIPDVLESYRKLMATFPASKPRPQLVVVGHGSIDDPDGAPIYNIIRHTLNFKKYRHLNADIKVARPPHIDQILNALVRQAHVILQLSHKEGFEVKVSEALMKGIPVIAYKSGGIPLQIQHGLNGFLVAPGNTAAVATYLRQLFTDQKLYAQLSHTARTSDYYPLTTVANATNWLYLAHFLSTAAHLNGQGQPVNQLLKRESSASTD